MHPESNLKKIISITLDPACNALYSSYYIYGCLNSGFAKVTFDAAPFRDLPYLHECLAFIISYKGRKTKCIIDHANGSVLHPDALSWSEHYGKVNLHPDDVDVSKVFPIGPLFAVQYADFPTIVLNALSNYVLGIKRIPSFRIHFSHYKGLLKREKMISYQPGFAKNDYIYFAAGLWKKEETYNQYRSHFIEVCSNLTEINFEGGLAPRRKKDIPGFEKLTMKKRVPGSEFICKTKQSLLVFNTPSVRDCNGWRLAEYLCLGKLILTTPLKRVMPGNFINGIHYLETDGTKKDIEQKIIFLRNSPDTRSQMENQARLYFENELQPQRVMEKFLQRIAS